MKRDVYIIGGMRTPFTKSMTAYSGVTTQTLMTATLNALANKFNLSNQTLGDVGIGGTLKNSMDWNFARECVLGSSLNPRTPAFGHQRACGSSLDTVNTIGLKIICGQMENGIAGGVDSNSDLPMLFPRSFSQKMLKFNSEKNLSGKMKALLGLRPSDFKMLVPSVREPRTGLSMGEHCELMVKEWGVSRAEQDALSLGSHQNAIRAYNEGFYEDLVFEFQGLKRDSIVRADTSLEKLGKLPPVFDKSAKGTLTAGNSSPLTDGAAAVLMASPEEAQSQGWTPLARMVDAEVAAVDFVHGEGLLMAPTVAVAKLLERNHLTLQDFDFYEIHEAFAGQVLCTMKAWESADYCQKILGHKSPLGSIDRNKLNVKGGSVALGHPFGATGARIVASLAKTIHEAGKGRGLISICTAGGMGVTMILDNVPEYYHG